jgi:hypothetical protein
VKRDDAIVVIKELLDTFSALDGCSFELAPPASALGGYQIVIRGILGQQTIAQVQQIAAKHQLAIQVGNIWKTRHTLKEQSDTLIIYKPKK